MSGRAHSESIIKDIIREIQALVCNEGTLMSETLIAFMIKALVLNPTNGFDEDRELSADDVRRLIKLGTEELTKVNSIRLETLQQQVFFDENFTPRKTFLKEHHALKAAKLKPLLRDICDARARTKQELALCYRKVTSYIISSSAVGTSTDTAVMRAATAALESVMPQPELSTLIRLQRDEKEHQLRELMHIVTGIRLYNRKIGKSSVGIDDFIAIINRKLPKIEQSINEALEHILPIVYKFAALLEREVDPQVRFGIDPTVRLEFADILAHYRQKEVFVKIIKGEVSESKKEVLAHLKNYNQLMANITETVKSKKTVNTADVFPRFQEVSRAWLGIQDDLVLLTVLDTLLKDLAKYPEKLNATYPDSTLEPFLAGLTIVTDAERLERTQGEGNRISMKSTEEIKVFYPEKVVNFNQMQTEFKGFCAFSLAVGEGLLLHGNPNIGILSFQDKYYSFSSKEAAHSFSVNPAGFLHQIMFMARQRPYLIPLLDLHTAVATDSLQVNASRPDKKPVTKCEMGIQTDVHAPTRCFVKSYEWNEWALRQQAVKLANLRTKLTKSTQTHSSGYRVDVETQIYETKSSSTQTTTEKHTRVPKPRIYYAGLRGTEESTSKPGKIDLTPTVDTDNIAEDL